MTGLFINTVRSVSEKFELDITPSGFTFSIWGVIYFWLTAAIIFCKYYPIYKIYNSTCLSVSLLFYVCHHFSGVHPYDFNYLFVIILCCPSFLFYTYICVCHHFILSILFILPLYLSSSYNVHPFYFTPMCLSSFLF